MMFDRFDIAEAYWCYFTEWHGGQNSREYARLSRMSHYFKPRHNLSSETLEENAMEIYLNLVLKHQGRDSYELECEDLGVHNAE